ncbi:MAG: hypothetical protein B6D36_12490, partial [Planctomycetes bacterium UTPLA1]
MNHPNESPQFGHDRAEQPSEVTDSGLPVLSDARNELQAQMARDLDRLRRVSSHLSEARSWAEQYPDEASALEALAGGASIAGVAPSPSHAAPSAFGRQPAKTPDLMRLHTGQWQMGSSMPSAFSASQFRREPVNYSSGGRGATMAKLSATGDLAAAQSKDSHSAPRG